VVDHSLEKTTILLLVSDPIVRSVLQETLEREGYIVRGHQRPGAGGRPVEAVHS